MTKFPPMFVTKDFYKFFVDHLVPDCSHVNFNGHPLIACDDDELQTMFDVKKELYDEAMKAYFARTQFA